MITQLLEKPFTVTKQKSYPLSVFDLPVLFTPLPSEPVSHSKHGLAVSEETYWERYYESSGDRYYDANYEWNNGYLEEIGMSTHRVTFMSDWLQLALQCYFSSHAIGKILGGGVTGFRIPLAHKTAIRKPDIAVVLNSNTKILKGEERSYRGIFDLCIESLSDSSKQDIERDTINKKREYAEAGVQEYYIVDDTDRMAFYWLNEWGEYEEIEPVEGDIIRSKVLPGFQFRKSDLLRQPSLEEMVEDEVYREYVLPLYQEQKKEKELALQRAEQERQRAEQERQQKELALQHAEQEQQRAEQERQQKELALQHAEQEQQRAEQERHRAELFAAKLRELGINPESILF